MISAKEAAEAMRALLVATQQSQMEIEEHRLQITRDQLAIDHDCAMALAQKTQDEMNAASDAYIKSEWAKNHPSQTASEPWEVLGSYYANGYFSLNRVGQAEDRLPPKPERILPWQLSRDDLAELHLWWDWKQLPDEVKSEMPPPPSPSAMTQAFMDMNPAWRFSPVGTLVADCNDSGLRKPEGSGNEEPWLNRAWVEAFVCTGLVTGLFLLVFVLAPMITGH